MNAKQQKKAKIQMFSPDLRPSSRHAENNRKKKMTQEQGLKCKKGRHEPPKKTQLFLDLGQKLGGKRESCPDCAFIFIQGDDEEEREHKRFCKKLRLGIPFSGWKNERLVKRFPDGARIIQVRPRDPHAHLVKLAEVHAIMDKEMGFAEDQVERSTFLYIKNNRVIGCTTAQELKGAFRLLNTDCSSGNGNEDSQGASGKENLCSSSSLLPNVTKLSSRSTETCTAGRIKTSFEFSPGGGNEDDELLETSKQSLFCESIPTIAHIGIHQIWVNKAHRRQGIASRMVETVRQNMRFGFVAKKKEVAFSQPTFQGLKFAHAYMGGKDMPLLIY